VRWHASWEAAFRIACEGEGDYAREAAVAIEIRQTKRTVVYRVVVAKGDESGATIAKTFRSRAAAVAWEREMLEGATPASQPGDPPDAAD